MLKILLAEDDKNFGHVLKKELEEEGYIVDLAIDGVEAALDFIGGAYNFVLLDIKMPRLDGINALRIIKRLNPDIPAITFSGNAGSGEMAESVRVGAIRCLTKGRTAVRPYLIILDSRSKTLRE
ncbi:MAG: response regulator [Nitrospirae bacterium]|nr:response regulator [Nitrospirota bacterium]